MARTVIVTGSSSGIGKATAVAFARAGYDVGVTWFDNEVGAKETCDAIAALGRRAEIAYLDLGEPESAPQVMHKLIESLGGLDALVNNAAMGYRKPFLEQPLDDWRRVLDVNLAGPLVCAQAAARHMIETKRKGRIINITSVHEHVPLEHAAAYCASKGGLGLLTKVMALELAPHGITVNAIAPGEIATRMSGDDDEVPEEHSRPMIPLERAGSPREIAEFVVFLASPEASYSTGASFVVDGGLLLMAGVANQRASD